MAQVHGHVSLGDTGAGGGIDQEGRPIVDGQTQLAPSVAETLEVGVTGWVRQSQSRQLRHWVTYREERSADAVRGREDRFAQELHPESIEFGLRQVTEGADKALVAGDAAVDVVRGEMVVDTHVDARDAGTQPIASWASATIMNTKFGGQK